MVRWFLALLVMLIFGSCAGYGSSARKCNGAKGTRVPMGIL